MKALIVLISSLCIQLTAFASGTTIGNGGNVVECKMDNAIQKLELLDFYEAKVFRGLDQDPILQIGTVKEIIGKVLDRLARLSPQRAQILSKEAEAFFNEVLFMPSGSHLERISDSEHIGIPNECKISQVVIQREPKFPEDKRYYINTDVWERLDNKNRAGIILHELLYREVLNRYSVTNSIGVRYINSILWSSKSISLEQDSFNALLDKAGYCKFETQGAFLSNCSDIKENDSTFAPIVYYSSGLIRKGYVVENSWITIRKQKIFVAGWIYFYESGEISDFTTNEEVILQNEKGLFKHFPKGKEISVTKEGLVKGILN